MDYHKTGRVIAGRRQELGLTQKQLAEQLNISDRTVSRWERGVGFPDVSLLEPLADALGLSLGELIRGERLPPAQQPSPEAEQEVRAVTIDLGGHLRRLLRRTRRLLIVLAALLACALIVFGELWFNPMRYFVLHSKAVSAAEASEICPFSLITRQEFELAARLLADEEIAELFSAPGAENPPLHKLDPGVVDAGALRIDGQEVYVIGIYVRGLVVSVEYSTAEPGDSAPSSSVQSCTLTIFRDGTIRKVSALYKDREADYVVENTDNTAFTLHREQRDLLYFLHGYE